MLVFPPKGVYKKPGEVLFTGKRSNGFKLNAARFKLAIRKRFKAVSGQRVLGHQFVL